MRRTWILLGLTSWCVGCDQGTKRIATYALKGHGMRLLGGAFELTYAENTGAFGSLGASWPAALRLAVFVILPLGVLAGLAVHAVRATGRPIFTDLAGALVVGGGLGNIIDRLHAGYVVDFMILRAGPLSTNVFNVADIAVMAGVGLLLLESVRAAPPPPAPV